MSSSGPGGPDGEKAQHVSARAHTIDASELHRSLIPWGKENSRSFPWRHTGDPFAVLMAEMMLRRTQARQVVGVYASFIQRFPNARALAVASPEEVERSLYSLGLAWRVPAFQRLARVLVEEYKGGVPTSYEALVALPGVGGARAPPGGGRRSRRRGSLLCLRSPGGHRGYKHGSGRGTPFCHTDPRGIPSQKGHTGSAPRPARLGEAAAV